MFIASVLHAFIPQVCLNGAVAVFSAFFFFGRVMKMRCLSSSLIRLIRGSFSRPGTTGTASFGIWREESRSALISTWWVSHFSHSFANLCCSATSRVKILISSTLNHLGVIFYHLVMFPSAKCAIVITLPMYLLRLHPFVFVSMGTDDSHNHSLRTWVTKEADQLAKKSWSQFWCWTATRVGDWGKARISVRSLLQVKFTNFD